MTYATVRNLGAAVLASFVALSFWANPAGTADVFGDLLAEVGVFFSAVIDKGAEFVHGLTD